MNVLLKVFKKRIQTINNIICTAQVIRAGWVLQIYISKQTNITVLQVYKSRLGYCRYTLVNKQILCTLYCRFVRAGWDTADIHL